jgi:hypothetical protein
MKSLEHIANNTPPKIRSAENVGRTVFFSCKLDNLSEDILINGKTKAICNERED